MIELHSIDNGQPLWLNPMHIVKFEAYDGVTFITCSKGDLYKVTESLPHILEAMTELRKMHL